MLVSDAEPHYAFFSGSSAAPTVCAHLVFCSFALVARANLHAKVNYILRLYTVNDHGQLPMDRKRQVLFDVLEAIPRVLAFAEPIEGEVVTYLEKTLVVGDDSGTCRDLYTLCFTTARVSGYLHRVQAIVDELGRFRERSSGRQILVENSPTPAQAPEAVAGLGQSGRLKLLNRGATTLQLTAESPLWTVHTSDLLCFHAQNYVLVAPTTTVFEAFEVMRQSGSTTMPGIVVSVVSTGRVDGLVTMEDLCNFLMDLFPADSVTTTCTGDYSRAQTSKVASIFQDSTMASVLSYLTGAINRDESAAEMLCAARRYQTIADDECLFNTVVRFVCGTYAVTVVSDTTPAASEASHADAEWVPTPLRGCIAVFDVLDWMLGDLSVLNGKERWAVSSFPSFYCTPVSIETVGDRNRPATVLDALTTMKTHRVTGLLVAFAEPAERHVLESSVLLHLFEVDPLQNGASNVAVDINTPLESLRPMLSQCDFVSGESSLASVVCMMATKRTRRVYLSENGVDVVGVVRAVDVFKVLLREQHRKSRRSITL